MTHLSLLKSLHLNYSIIPSFKNILCFIQVNFLEGTWTINAHYARDSHLPIPIHIPDEKFSSKYKIKACPNFYLVVPLIYKLYRHVKCYLIKGQPFGVAKIYHFTYKGRMRDQSDTGKYHEFKLKKAHSGGYQNSCFWHIIVVLIDWNHR